MEKDLTDYIFKSNLENLPYNSAYSRFLQMITLMSRNSSPNSIQPVNMKYNNKNSLPALNILIGWEDHYTQD